jgi:spore maturation protein CgeB
MLNVIFFNSKTFLNKEVLGALRRRTDIHTLAVDIPVAPPVQSVNEVFEQLRPFLPAVVISLNEAGYDQAGVLSSLLSRTGSFQANWYYDDPLYERIMYKRAMPDLKRRIEFVSERSFVPILAEEGIVVHFLPLAVDPGYFNIDGPKPEYRYDISFVGNSSLEFLDSLVSGPVQQELDKFKDLLVSLKRVYYANPRENLREYLWNHSDKWKNRISIDPEMFVFVMVWMVGYFFRKDFIVDLAKTYKNRFMCLGDIYWTQFIDKSQVSTDAMYYKNLCSYYRSTKINININRVQTLTSFTQRIFDCKASGAFLLTDKREMNAEYFVTEGADREIVEYTSLAHCKQLIDYFLVHDEEREKIGLSGREKVLKHHTYDNRIEEMLSVCRETWEI